MIFYLFIIHLQVPSHYFQLFDSHFFLILINCHVNPIDLSKENKISGKELFYKSNIKERGVHKSLNKKIISYTP